MRRIALCLVALALGASCGGDDDDGAFQRIEQPDLADLSYDDVAPLDPASTPVPDPEIGVERIEYTTFDGTRVPGYFITDGEPGACLIIQHGAGATREDGRTLERVLRGLGVDVSVLAIDAREHGERAPGGVTRAPNDAQSWTRVVRETAIDLRRALDYLEARPECDPARLGLFGISMGGFTGTLTAAVDDRVRATVFLSSGADYQLLLEQTEGLFPEIDRDDAAAVEAAVRIFEPIDPLYFVADIAPRPLLMINGEEDRLIPADVADALHDAAGEGAEVVWHAGGHNPNPTAAMTYGPALLEFLTEHLVGP